MIQNIVILLVANTIIPMIPVPPQIFAPLPLSHFLVAQTSVYEHMNLSRLHTQQQFKKSFRQSLKSLHPDRGGSSQAFSKVKNLKKIMQMKTNYYDTLNITDVDLQYNIPMKDIVSIKQTTYFVQTGIFYFIILLYGLAFTIDDDLKPSRKYILPLTFMFGFYELYIHYYPQNPTLIDYINDKVPIFVQKTILKNFIAVLVAAIRTKFLRTKTPQKKLLEELNKDKSGQDQTNLLAKLTIVYQQKADAKKKADNSWGAKIRDWISKGFSLFVLFSLIRGFIWQQ